MTSDEFDVVGKPLVYLAAPLFSDAEKRYNEEVAKELGNYFTIYLPQRDGGLMVDLIKRGHSAAQAGKVVFDMDTRAIQMSSAVIAILDGRVIDEGVALELGYAYALGKPCYGFQTDPRRLLPSGNNPMVMGVLREIAHTIQELAQIARNLNAKLVMPR